MLCRIHALLKALSHDSQDRNRDVVTPVGLNGREQPANLQGMTKTSPTCTHSSLASLVQHPDCAMELVLQAHVLQHLSAPCTYPAALQCSMHKVHPGKVLSILTPASQQDPAAWHLPLAMGGQGWPRPAEPLDRLFS